MASTTDKTRRGLPLLPELIGFIFAFRACLTLLWFQFEPQQGAIASIALSLILVTVTALFSTGGTPSIPSSCFRTSTLRWIAALLGFSFLSLLWTTAPLGAAASYWAAWAADAATIWLVLRDGLAEKQAEAVMKGYVWGGCVIAAIAWSLPTMPDLRLGDVDFFHPNYIGLICATGTLVAMHLAHQKKTWRWPAFWLALTLIRTISKTSIVAFFVAMIFYLFRDKNMTRALRIKIALAGIVILGSLSGLLMTYFDNYTESTNPETLTGRTVIWSSAAEIAVEKPILGHGFYAFRFLVPPIGTFEATHAHNELLQQFFALGALGVVLVIGLYWAMFRQICRSPKSSLKTLAATLLIFALVRGLADTQTFDLSYPLWLMTLLSILLASLNQPEPNALIE
jgi:exopolysaccharide production protein ExoQ